MLIEARGLRKSFGPVTALDGFDLSLAPGRIVGLIGPNGSGKTTALKSLLGLSRADQGAIRVLGLDPWRERAALMRRVGYIADVGVLPRWMRVRELLATVRGVHPRFRPDVALAALAGSEIRQASRIGALSKGMLAQLHLAVVLALDAQLLVLDEPTLGLDLLHRQHFYDRLLSEFFAGDRAAERGVLITTHEVREVEHLLTDVAIVHQGRTLLADRIDALAQRFSKLTTAPEAAAAPRRLQPIAERITPSGVEFVFDGVPREALTGYGVVTTPALPDLFVALLGHGPDVRGSNRC